MTISRQFPLSRRSMLHSLGGLSLVSLLPQYEALAQSAPKLRIEAVEVWKFEGHEDGRAGSNRQYQMNPGRIHEDPRFDRPPDQPAAQTSSFSRTAYYVKIKTNQGVEGIYGPVDKEACIVVQQQLARVVEGRDALAGELLWDVMYRSNRHARYGHYMMGIAAVDNALWDLRGKFFNVPVHLLLGGPSRDELECYASCNGCTFADEQMEAQAKRLAAEGFRHQKYFAAWGPREGEEGLELNVNLVRRLREAVGPKVRLMIDAFNGWDLPYAMQWCKRVEQFEPWWLEEAFPSAHLEAYEKLRPLTRIPLATGEHLYNRWEAKRFLDTHALQFIQVDPEWCGGLSECVKIVALASTQDTYVIAHGHNLHAAVHMVASQSQATCPLVECLVNKLDSYYYFDPAAPLPKRGRIAIPDAPGFGMKLDDARIEKRTLMNWA